MLVPRSRFGGRRRADPARKQRSLRDRLRARDRDQPGLRRAIPPVAVPSFFTLMNLFSGFMALTQIHEGRFEYACWLIVLAGLFDVMDGMMARLTNSSSPFGVELDSLSDIVSFGVAPGYLVYAFGLRPLGIFGLVVSALPAICGAVRLARFNVQFQGPKKEYFTGMPIPVQAISIVAIILNMNDAAWLGQLTVNNFSILVPITVVLAFLMVSTVPFDAMPSPSMGYIRSHPRKTLFFALGLLAIVFLQQIGLLLALFVYILQALVRTVVRVTAVVKHGAEAEAATAMDREGFPAPAGGRRVASSGAPDNPEQSAAHGARPPFEGGL